MELKHNLIIYGINRHQMDFECIFTQFHILGYVTLDNNRGEQYNGKPIFLIHSLNQDSLLEKDAIIIVCNNKTANKIEELETRGLQYGLHYLHVTDLLFLLDKFHQDLSRIPLIIWGTGSCAQNFLQSYQENWHSNLNLKYFMDNGIDNKNITYSGKPVINPNTWEWSQASEYFFVVASTSYQEIRKQLESHGLQEYKNFIYYSTALIRPSLMLKKVLSTDSIDGPQCPLNANLELRADGVFPCSCAPHLKLPIGDIHVDDLDNIWHSKAGDIFRLSLINHTYCFCRLESCFYKKNSSPLSIYSAENVRAPKTLRRISFSLDETCNLFCDKCRTAILRLPQSKVDKRVELMTKLLNSSLVTSAPEIYLAGGGELFASDVYKKALFRSNIKFWQKGIIITNLQLFSKNKFNDLKKLFNDIELTISIDGATKKTYESIHRGARFERLQENLEIVSLLRKENKISKINITMVIQKQNYKEIPQLIDWMENLGFDEILLEKIRNWGTFPNDDFIQNISMFDKDLYLPKPELQSVLNKLYAVNHSIRIDLG